jgi:glycerol-3-phosphate dehydrogenase
MKRDLRELADTCFDILIVGGGIQGATLAQDAALRGARVALIEKDDFGAATSSNSLKIIHGGFRYLQSLDFKRMRQSIRERSNLLRIAPHLVHPLPVLVPTYGHGLIGKEAMRMALLINDLISADRNSDSHPGKRIPAGKLVSKSELLELAPAVEAGAVSGGMIFYDAQVYNSERLTLGFLVSAANAGATVANYVEAYEFIRSADRVLGVRALDKIGGSLLEIRARTIVNATGPWVPSLLSRTDARQPFEDVHLVKAINLITRPIFQNHAVGMMSAAAGAGSWLKPAGRFLFTAPWRGKTLFGTAYFPHQGEASECRVVEEEIQSFLNDINGCCPQINLQRSDVLHVHRGLLPAGPGGKGTQLSTGPRIHNHAGEGLGGLISVLGVKYTTARAVAEATIDEVYRSWNLDPPQPRSARTALPGGDIACFDDYLASETGFNGSDLAPDRVRRLILNHGSQYSNVLKYLKRATAQADQESRVLEAETRHAVLEEMAHKLTDVVLRRTELGSAGQPSRDDVERCAEVMAEELGWDSERVELEIREVDEFYGKEYVRKPKLAAAPLQQVRAQAAKVYGNHRIPGKSGREPVSGHRFR